MWGHPPEVIREALLVCNTVKGEDTIDIREVNPDIITRGNGVVGADNHSDSHNIEMDKDIYNFIPSSNVQMMEITSSKTLMSLATWLSSDNIPEDLLNDRPDDTRVMIPSDEEEINLKCSESLPGTEDDFHGASTSLAESESHKLHERILGSTKLR